MPRFYFDSFDGRHLIRDEEGQDLADATTARREAIADAQEMIAGAIFRPRSLRHAEIRVRMAANDTPAFAVAFNDVIDGLRS